MEEKTLKLTLKKKWFNMILVGKKTEEYREFNDYWKSRLCIKKRNRAANLNDCVPRLDYTHVEFYNGGHFSKKLPHFKIELKRIDIHPGWEEWGAEIEKTYFVLKLGRVLYKTNC